MIELFGLSLLSATCLRLDMFTVEALLSAVEDTLMLYLENQFLI